MCIRDRPEPGAARDEPLAAGEAAADDALVQVLDVPHGRDRHRPLRLHLPLHQAVPEAAAPLSRARRGRSTCMCDVTACRGDRAVFAWKLYFRANV